MRINVIAKDREDRPVLLVVGKFHPRKEDDETLPELLDEMNARSPAVPFGMIVDPERSTVISADRGRASPVLFEFPTEEVLRYYDSEFDDVEPGDAWGYRWYILGMVEVWIQDLISSWKPGEPPWKEDARRFGLLKALERGSVGGVEDVKARDDSLC